MEITERVRTIDSLQSINLPWRVLFKLQNIRCEKIFMNSEEIA